MGNTINKDGGIVIRKVDEPGTEKGTETGTRGTGRSNTGESTTDSRTTGRTTGTNTGGSGRSTGRSTAKEQKEVIPGLPVLDDEKERKRLERNAKRRERYAKEKAEQGQSVKPRKVNTKKKQDEQKLSTEQLNTFVKTISLVVASRPNCEHWLLSDSEIESITTPLAKMLAESEIFEKLGEHSNQIALVTACVTVFMPRIIKTTMIMKEKKKYVGTIKKQQPRSEEKVININRNNDRGNEPKSNDQISSTNESWVNGIFY